MGKSSYREKRLAGQVSLALAAGMFSVVPVAHGMPTLDPAAPHTGGMPDAAAVIDANDPNKMNVTGSRTNNVVDWKDFSIAKGETVAFQNVNDAKANYMNIVTGHATSNIEGTMTNNGDIYLINPNGVIFGKTAQVNVGNLYVSTREASQNMADTFRGTNADPVNDVGTILSAVTMDNALKSDVVNLIDTQGYVKADKVVMEGNNIRFLNASSVIDKDTDVSNLNANDVILRANANGYIHVGDGGHVNANDSEQTDYTYAYTAQNVNTDIYDTHGDLNSRTNDVVNYALIRTATDLQNINNASKSGNNISGKGLSGNYMLANDITNAGSVQIGSGVYDDENDDGRLTNASKAFSGKFDGMFYTVSGLSQSDASSTSKYLGLFGYTNNARIENLGIAEARLTGKAVGGIVGYAKNTTLLNVWNAGKTDGTLSVGWATTVNAQNVPFTGGLVGYMDASTMRNAYNASYVAGAGLAGFLKNSTISDAYNTGKLETADSYLYGIFNGASGTSTAEKVYTASKKYNTSQAGQEVFTQSDSISVVNPNNCYIIDTDSKYRDRAGNVHTADMLTAGTYAFGSISSEGGSDSVWRIYEGASLPLLTSFMKAKGTVATDYSYNTIAADSSTATESSSAAYDFSQFKTDYSTTPVTYSTLPSKTYEAAAVGPTSVKYYGMNADGTGITTSDNKDAKTFALFYGGQQGYDLYGNNFTINKRNIKIGVNNNAVSKVYDGQSRNTVSGAGLLGSIVNADDTSKPGVISGDAVTIGGKVTYVYNNDDGQGNLTEDKNFGAKKVTITTDGLTLTGASKDNYNANFTAPTQPVSANITKRTIQVGLYNTSGITKTYDGTATVTNENKGDLDHGFVGAENVDTSTLTNVDGDAVWLANQYDTNGNPLTITIAGMLSDDNVEFDTSGVTSRYVKSDLATDAVNVADVAKVAYEGIALTGSESALANYQLSNGGKIYADGGMDKRDITSTDLGYGAGGSAITKVYDGSSTTSGGTVQDVTVGNQVAAGTTSTHTGLITTDATAVQFATTGTATFYLSNGTTATANATNYKGEGTGAQKVKYNVALKETNDITANYTVDGNDLDTATTYGVEGTGTITKRAITVELVKNSDLDKTYNGTTALDDGTAANYAAGSIAYDAQAQAFAATGNLRYATVQNATVPNEVAATDTGVKISITNAAYDTDENVAYDGSGNVTDKGITYTVAFNDVDAAYNYTLNTVSSTTEPASTTLAASGEISPRELSLSFGLANKTYDGDALVDTIPTVTVGNLVDGDSASDVFDSSKVAGRYGSDATGTFVTSANVGNYTSEADTAGAKVLYTGLKNNDGTYKDIKTAIKDTIKGKNYKISNTVYGKGIISKKTITTNDLDTATSVKDNCPSFTKVYDGSATDSSTAVTGLSWSDYLVWDNDQTVFAPTDRDNLTITIAEAIYANKDSNASAEQNVSLKYNIKGDAAANYEFEGATVTSNTDGSQTIAYTKDGYKGTITPRTVTVTMKDDATSPTKIYDGTTTVKATGVTTTAGVSTLNDGTWSNWFQLANVVENEDLQLADGITAAYASKDVAYDNAGGVTTQAVNYGNVALANGTSALASNYTLVNNIQGIGTINKRNVTLSDYGVAAATKTYDGDAEVEAYALTFANETQEGATDKSVLAADHITDATGKIVSNLSGTYLPTGSQTEGQGKDVLRDSTNRATILEKDVEYIDTAGGTTPLANLFGGNYNVTLASGGTYNSTTGKLTVADGGKINPAQIQVNNDEIVAAAANRVYDGTKSLENPAIDYLTFNNAELNAHRNDLTVTGAYDSKNAGARTVTYTISMDANNYDLSGDIYDADTGTATKMGSGTISKKTIYGVVGATASTQKSTISKVYDGYTTVEGADATTAKTWLTTNLAADGTGAVAITDEDGDLDDVSILTTGVTLAYKDANVATSDANDKVTYSGLALTGEDAENYTLGNTKDAEDKYVAYGYGSITPKSIAFAITVADGAYKKDYDEKTGLDGKLGSVDTTNSATLTGTVTSWWSGANGVRAAGDTTTFGNAFETDDSGNLVGYYGVWNPTTKTFTENPNVWADKANNKKTSDVYYGLVLKGDAAQNYVLASTGGTTGATINVNNTTIQDTVYFQNAMQGKGEIKPLAISMEKVKNEWGTFEKVYDGSTSVEGYLVSGAATPTKEQQLTIYYERDNDPGYTAGDVKIPYSVNAANYEDANAGNEKNIAYTGFSFNDSDLDNFIIPAADLRDKYADGKAATTTTGNIARRLLLVSTDKESHEKIYDGSAALFDGSKAYDVARASATNKTSGVVDSDFVNNRVSVTYVANFADANVNFNDTTETVDNKPVTYEFTLSGASKDNYELTTVSPIAYPAAHTGETWTPATDKLTKVETDGKIKQREVELALNGTIDKTYDGNADADVSGHIGFANKDRDVIAENIEIGTVTAKYLANGTEAGTTDAERAKNVAFGPDGAVTTKTVSVQNVNFLNNDDSVNHNYVAKTGLEGSGKIAQKQVAAHLNNKDITKTYDGDSTVSDEFGIGNVVVASGVIDGDQLGLGLVEPAFYYEKDGSGNIPANPTGYSDANETGGLGVKYLLKVDNKNYTLAKWRLDDEVTSAKITKRVLTQNGDAIHIEKTYDGTTALGDASSVTTGLFSNVLAKDKATLLTVTGGNYTSPDTGAASDSVQGAAQQITVNYQLTEVGHKNYKLDAGDTTTSGTYTGNKGYINRAQLTLTPNNVTYSAGDNIPTDGYAGSVTGWKNGDTLADGYDVTFKRDPQNLSTAPGNYQLLGYVNGDVAPTANGMVYYNNLLGNTGNYYFVTAPNQALHVEAKADVADAVHRDTIADKKFIPDDYSYNRMSQDEDLTRLKRESQATVQYTEKGVNTDESSQGGLLASMDIQGAGSVVNLNGAVIRTSAVPEKPEEIAAEAALPVSEASEADFSSIDVENTDESDGSQSMLEVLTNASNNAENRGTSIVINTMDEDEEDAEEEKSRRALIVDRSNIGIETLGDAVNLDQMIG